VHLTYDVEIGDAFQTKELPLVLGVLSDLSGKPEPGQAPKMKDQSFVEIDRDNFNKVLAATKPRLAFQVENTLQGDGSKLNLEMKFEHIMDFEPEQVVRKIEPLRKLLEARDRLRTLVNKMDGNDRLPELLQEVINNTDSLNRLSQETGRGTPEPERRNHEQCRRTEPDGPGRNRRHETGGEEPPRPDHRPGSAGPRPG